METISFRWAKHLVLKVSQCADPGGVNDLMAMWSTFLDKNKPSLRSHLRYSEPETQKTASKKASLVSVALGSTCDRADKTTDCSCYTIRHGKISMERKYTSL